MVSSAYPPSPRAPRRDAQANRERLLAAAVVEIQAHGYKVPMASIAERAGVGVGTLYRHFPTREDLLGALVARAFGLVLGRAERAAAAGGSPLDAIERFFLAAIRGREDLILPLHGAPTPLDAESRRLQARIREVLGEILRRGQQEGTIRDDVTARDIVITGAHLAQPLPGVADWDRLARRQARFYLAGLRRVSGST
jgi:AcrR family transcriptional regulator